MNKYINYFLLLASFAGGQGVLLLSNSKLIARGQVDTVGVIGSIVALLTFALWYVDFGGLYFIVSKHTHLKKHVDIVSLVFCRLSALIILCAICIILRDNFEYTKIYYSFFGVKIFVALLFWCFNIIGAFDAVYLASVGGLLSCIPWLSIAIGVLFITSESDELVVTIVGNYFLIGVVVSVLAQYGTYFSFQLKVFEFKLCVVKNFAEFFWYGLKYIISQLPAQLYGRIVIFLTGSIGATELGVYIYIKHIINALSQMVAVMRRIQFSYSFRGNFAPFSFSRAEFIFIVSFISAVSFIAFVATITIDKNSSAHIIAEYFKYFIIGFCLWMYVSKISNDFLLHDKSSAIAMINIFCTAFSVAIIYSYRNIYGLYAIVASELFMHLLQIIGFKLYLSYSANQRIS